MSWIEERVATVAGEFAAAKDKYLLEMFGDRESLERYADDFVFEEYPIEANNRPDFDGSTTLTFRQRFRLRPKTDEERAAEQARESTSSAGES